MATITVFIGSMRMGRIGDKVAKHISKTLESRGHTVHLIDPAEHTGIQTLTLPNHYNPKPSEDMLNLHNWLDESDGFILVTPEYNHSFSGTLKDAIDNFMPEYYRKAFGIVSYSIGPFGGVRANEALRQVVSELKAVPTPLPLLIPMVQNVFDAETGALKDTTLTEREAKFLTDFEWYVKALKAARTN